MNELDAMIYCNILFEECGIKKIRGIKEPEPRLLEDLGINEEGYCIFCEGYRKFQRVIQGCVRTFARKFSFEIDKNENDIILKEIKPNS